MIHLFLWKRMAMRVCARRGDAWFTGITIGNWMFGVWHWPQRKRGER